MSTNTKNAAAAQSTAAAEKNAKKVETVNRPSIPGNEKNNEPAKPEPAKTEPAKAEPATPAAQASPAAEAAPKAARNEQEAAGNEQPKGEEVNNEPKAEVKYIKPAMNLEQTVKYVEGLHRKNIGRLALIGRIQTLEKFEITLAENGDQLESNIYTGCKLTIEDDKGNKFITNTPNLIRMVSQFVFETCLNRLAEIESEIVFPN